MPTLKPCKPPKDVTKLEPSASALTLKDGTTAQGYYYGDVYYEKIVRPDGRVNWYLLTEQ